MSQRGTRATARAAAIGLPVLGAAIGLAAPHSMLWGGIAWLGFLLAVLAGWGHLVARLARLEVDLGLRLAWGTAALLAVTAALLAVGVADRTALAALLVVGAGAHAWREVTVAEPSLIGWARAVRILVRDPQVAILVAALAALIAVNVLGGITLVRPNVYDDDVAYTAFVKRLLDVGDLDEPFSFRRISAFGGQTVLSALGAVRGTLDGLYLVDHGLFQLVAVLLLVGLIRRRDVDRMVGGLVLLVMLFLPDASINAASYWSGVALFLALYRTIADGDRAAPEHDAAAAEAVEPVDDRAPARFAIAGLVAAGACSLRQNHLPVALGFVGLCLVLRLRRPLRASFAADRAAWLGALVAGGLALLPWLVTSWRSNHTFLYPLQLGTINPHMPMGPTAWSAWQELQLFLDVVLQPDPIRVLVPLAPILLLARDRRRGRPLTALTLASALGLILLIHSFALSDARNLWRYTFGFSTALVALVVLEGARRGLRPGPATGERVGLPLVARFWIVGCLLAQLASTSRPAAREYAATGAQLAAAARTHARPEREAALPARYRALQAAVPAGAPLVVLLDQPAYLDYARNRIINVDTPGYASYAPGLPYFRGSEPVAAYLRGHGLRHVAFVRGDHSRYFYRRELWLARIQFDAELWRVVGAYIVDLLDTFADLATRYPVLHDEDGLVVVDLGAGAGPGAQDAATAPGDAEPEPAARERFVHDLLVREGLGDTWAIMGRADVVFADGWSRVLPPDPELVPRWRGFAATVPSRSARAVRWLGVRGHVRVRADAPRPHRLRVWGAVDRVALFTRPRLTVTFDGRELDSRLVAADGAFMVEAVIPGEQLEGWSDVYLTLSSVSEPWREPERLRLARVEGVTWEPAP